MNGKLMSKKAFIVTGSLGYIGSHLVSFLKEKHPNSLIIGYDINASLQANNAVTNLDKISMNGIELDCIFHLAATSNVEECNSNPLSSFWNNINSTKNIIDFAKKNANSIVFASSCAVYDESSAIITEKSKLRNFDLSSVYGASKIACEQLLECAYQQHGLKYIALRLGNVAGEVYPNTENHSPETHLIPRLLKNDDFSFYGKPEDYIRCYVHVTDVCNAFYSAYKSMNVPYRNPDRIYNIAGFPYKNSDLLEIRNYLLPEKTQPSIEPLRVGDIKSIVMSDKKAQTDLHWIANNDMLSIMKSYIMKVNGDGNVGDNGSNR